MPSHSNRPMKYFSALADAEFARAAFAAAGLDFDALKSAKNTDCLKSALAAGKTSAEAEAILAAAKKENDDLSAQLSAAKKKGDEIEAGRSALAARHTSLVTALDGAGVKLADSDFNAEKPDETAAALKAKIEGAVTKTARLMVAKAGHPGLLDEINADATKPKKPEEKKPEATGRDRLRAIFQQDAIRLHQRERGAGAN